MIFRFLRILLEAMSLPLLLGFKFLKVFTKFLPHQTSAYKLIISKSIKLNYIKVVTVRKQSSLQDQELNEVELKQQDRQSWIYSRSQSNLQVI